MTSSDFPVTVPISCKVYTPPALANAIARVVFRSKSQTWLEPGFGRGAFIEAVSSLGVPRDNILGVELDVSRHKSDRLARVKRGSEFLEWSQSTSKRFDCIVSNPPYVAIRALDEPLRSRAASIEDGRNSSIGHRSNLWYAFLLRSLKLLKQSGSMAFILPAAAEYADYCALTRSDVTSLFDRVDMIRSRSPLFDDVQEGAVVAVFQGFGGKGRHYRRHEVADLAGCVTVLGSLPDRAARACPPPCRRNAELVPLGDVVRVRLGGVTGQANYFVLSEQDRIDLGLPKVAVRKVVTKSHHLRYPLIDDRVWQNLRDDGERIWLFRPSGKTLEHKAVKRYLRRKATNGGCDRSRYKIANRTPWYTTPLPPRPDAFMSGMSSDRPFICFNDHSTLSATNTLYVIYFRGSLSRDAMYAWSLALLSSSVRKQVKRARRIYAAGLKKLEPADLTGLLLPSPGHVAKPASAYRSAIAQLLDGDDEGCARLADDALGLN